MAKIQSVDYNQMANSAGAIKATAVELNREITTAYNSVNEMRNVWYGTRYNELLDDMNSMVVSVNDLLDLVVVEIPVNLQTIANNYSAADTGANVTAVDDSPYAAVENIAHSTEVGMRFQTSDVESVKNSVGNNFTTAVSKMDEIKSTFNGINWESEAAEAFRSKLDTLTNSVTESFNNIKNRFDSLMVAAQQDIDSAETANTVS